MIGIWPVISSCQRCAAAPSSSWRATPTRTMWLRTTASAPSDMSTGKSALGRVKVVDLTSERGRGLRPALPTTASQRELLVVLQDLVRPRARGLHRRGDVCHLAG